MNLLVFESEQFRPYLPDEFQVNPNVLGFELASWLSKALADKGIITSYPHSEDWGWFLERIEGGVTHMICCSGSETDGGSHEWRIYVMQPKRLFRRPAGNHENTILQMVAALLKESGISIQTEEE